MTEYREVSFNAATLSEELNGWAKDGWEFVAWTIACWFPSDIEPRHRSALLKRVIDS